MHDNYCRLRLEELDKGMIDRFWHNTNPKFEARNPKQHSNDQNHKRIDWMISFCVLVLGIGISDFEFVSCFGFRYSDLFSV